MTTDADRAREIAETVFPLGGFGCDGAHSRLYNRIASALTAARKAPEGCVIDDKGTVRKVLGTLPITADGCVCGLGEYSMWHRFGSEHRSVMICAQWPFGHEYDPASDFDEVYSTRDAAEAAKGASDGRT